MKKKSNAITLGRLITALYEEISKLTPNKKTQMKLVYLALLDMQRPERRGL